MSKTTPEEAKSLAQKYCLVLYGWDFERLAALIDEVREVDAEPVGYRWKWDDGILDASHPLAGWQIGNVLPDIHPANKDHITVEAVYTHPAPSQPVQDERSEWLQESAYRAGAAAGFNLGVSEDHEGLERLKSAHAYPKPAAPVELPVMAVISSYAIPVSDKRYADEILIQRSRQIEGPPLWAVRLNGDCLNKSGEWEWEPMPSSRDDEFLDRCRFPTAQEAIQAAIAAGRKAS